MYKYVETGTKWPKVIKLNPTPQNGLFEPSYIAITNRKVGHKVYLSRIMRKLMVLHDLDHFVLLQRFDMTSQDKRNIDRSDF